MVSGAGLKTVAVAGVLAAAVGGAVIARADDPSGTAAQAGGGLAISTTTGSADSTLMVDRAAQAGAADKLKVANNTNKALVVTVTARPWTQSASGVASPEPPRDARPASRSARVSSRSLPGASKDLTVTLDGVPSAGYLYGALEVVGLPTDLDKSKGVVAGYRLVNSLRYNAATADLRPQGGRGQGLWHGLQADADAERAQHRQHDRAGDRQREAQGRARHQERRAQVDADPARQERRASASRR